MSFLYVFAWWHIPTLVTLIGLGFVFWVARKDYGQGGWFAGLTTLLSCVPTFFVVGLTWAIAGFCK